MDKKKKNVTVEWVSANCRRSQLTVFVDTKQKLQNSSLTLLNPSPSPGSPLAGHNQIPNTHFGEPSHCPVAVECVMDWTAQADSLDSDDLQFSPE